MPVSMLISIVVDLFGFTVTVIGRLLSHPRNVQSVKVTVYVPALTVALKLPFEFNRIYVGYPNMG